MPSTYAHYRMGQEVRKLVPSEESRIIEAYPELFLIGLHGPDILFYYNALFTNPVNQVGFGLHEKSGISFFARQAEMIRERQDGTPYLSYLYGYICHFSLDTTCHGYIDEKISKSGVTHTEIEAEFDRELMLLDGKDPVRQKLTGHIVPSMENAKIIEAFYPGISPEQVRKSLKSMIFYNDMLIAPNRWKRGLILGMLRLTGNYKEMHGLLINAEANPACADSTAHLSELYVQARDLAVRLISEFKEYLAGSVSLDQIYRYTFGSRLTNDM